MGVVVISIMLYCWSFYNKQDACVRNLRVACLQYLAALSAYMLLQSVYTSEEMFSVNWSAFANCKNYDVV
jgi:hypothetical protein